MRHHVILPRKSGTTVGTLIGLAHSYATGIGTRNYRRDASCACIGHPPLQACLHAWLTTEWPRVAPWLDRNCNRNLYKKPALAVLRIAGVRGSEYYHGSDTTIQLSLGGSHSSSCYLQSTGTGIRGRLSWVYRKQRSNNRHRTYS